MLCFRVNWEIGKLAHKTRQISMNSHDGAVQAFDAHQYDAFALILYGDFASYGSVGPAVTANRRFWLCLLVV